jgi:circadian clock protein KaiC
MKKTKVSLRPSPQKAEERGNKSAPIPESPRAKVKIRQLPTGVRGLDEILGGGLPEFSFNILAGSPGCGKTTLAHQIVFANATPEKPALYFTVPGEPALKMLRYQQQYSFFDSTKMGTAVRFINLSSIVLEQNLDAVLAAITHEVESVGPSLGVVDSFRTVIREAWGQRESDLQGFIQRLALLLTSWEATTFLIGEYSEAERHDNPVFTVADGLFWLTQNAERNSVVRKMQIMKLRGQESVPGLHTIRITSDGFQAFSRTLGLSRCKVRPSSTRRLSAGVFELDKMLGGGILEGDSVLGSGPSGQNAWRQSQQRHPRIHHYRRGGGGHRTPPDRLQPSHHRTARAGGLVERCGAGTEGQVIAARPCRWECVGELN